MTNEAERTPMTNSEAEFAKQHRSKKISRYSDESKNPCVKVTALFTEFTDASMPQTMLA